MEIDEYAGYKFKYNVTLKRYYAGCNYLIEHPEETEKYLPKIMEFKDDLDEIIKRFARDGRPMKEVEILTGFEN